jgi:hypothetical protein
MPPNNPAVVLVRMLFSRDTRTFVNTFHVTRSTAWTTTNMGTLANMFVTWWSTQYRNLAWTGVALYQVQVRLYDPTNPLAFDLTLGTPAGGTVGSAPDPASATLSTSWRTGLAGRKYRGRFYTVGMVEAQSQDNDTVTSGYVTSAGTVATALLSDLAAAALSLVIFHRVDNTFTPVISTIVENLVDSQRRRLAGRGR